VSSLPRPQLAAHRSGGTGVGDTDQQLVDVVVSAGIEPATFRV
jgi:hypothetical protein